MMRICLPLLLASACFAQTPTLSDRVLILVNDHVPNGLPIARYYAEKRQVPPSQILRLKTSATQTVSLDEYRDQIENPLRKYLDANNGAMRRKILYIVPVFGVPLKVPEKFAVDSLISFMYAGHENEKPPLRNPYSGATGSRPPKFAEWSDGPAAQAGFKMFVVSRLDGPTPEIAKGLIDKAIEAEKTVTRKTGFAYFDYQGFRDKSEWQWAVDDEIRDGAERAKAQGFQTVLHTQAQTACHAQIAPATQYVWDETSKTMLFSARGSTGGLSFPIPETREVDFTARLQDLGTGLQNSLTLTLAGPGERSLVRLIYPFVPFAEYDATGEAVLEKVVDGTVAARTTIKMKNDGKIVNNIGDLKLSVRADRIVVTRAGAELMSLEDKTGKPLTFTSAAFTAQCWNAAIRTLRVDDAAGTSLWLDEFRTDSSARYHWKITPPGGTNAMWVWGWYSGAADAYRFLSGAVGAQLTSYTADRIREPNKPDPKLRSWNEERWAGNWVPRMLEEGVTATWGAVAEPYATYYARGTNVFDHMWAGYNFGDSFYIAQNALRWVMVAIGDPLYAPAAFAK
jgi:uncharacterized protein (TIGR03790 family)